MIFIHWRTRRLIHRYLAGVLSDPDRTYLEKHFDHCEKCRSILTQEQQLTLRIKDGFKLLDETWKRIETQMDTLPPYFSYPRTQTTLEQEPFSSIPTRYWRSALVTVCVVVLVFVGIWGYQRYTSNLNSIQVTEILGPQGLRKSPNRPGWDNLGITTKLHQGDQIQTDDYSLVTLKLGKLGQVWLNHSTQLTLTMNSSTTLNLQQGEIYVSVVHSNKKFRVLTPAGWVEVYGTEFNIAVDPVRPIFGENNILGNTGRSNGVDTALRTIVTCLQDTVSFENSSGRVLIPSGYQQVVTTNTPLGEPQPVDDNSVGEWKSPFNQFAKLSVQEREQLRKKYITQGNQLFDQHRYEEAITNYRKAIVVNPKHFSAYYGIGRCYLTMGQYAQATSGYFLALERSPKEISCLYQLTFCLIELHQYTLAEQYGTQLTTLQPSYHGSWVLVGELAMLQGDFTKAKEMYQHAVETGAETCPYCGPRMHAGLAEIARQQNDFPTAQAELAKVEKYNPGQPPAIFYAITARLSHNLNNTTAEKSAWLNYLQIDPQGGFAQEAKQRLAELESAP